MGKGNRRRNNRDDSTRGDASTTSSVGDDSKTIVSDTSRSTADKRKKRSTPSASASASSTLHTTTGTGDEGRAIGKTATDNDATEITTATAASGGESTNRSRSFFQWCFQERQGIIWIVGCMFVGSVFGFCVGSGWFMGEHRKSPSTWKINLGGKIRAHPAYRNTVGKIPIERILGETMPTADGGRRRNNKAIRTAVEITRKIASAIPFFPSNTRDNNNSKYHHGRTTDSSSRFGTPSVVVRRINSAELKRNPSHPYVYAVLREAVAREKNGYVHPDLGIMEPAPCGAARGIGMVRNVYHRCQTRCVPGLAREKLDAKQKKGKTDNNRNKGQSPRATMPTNDDKTERRYMQEEVLIRVPLSYQMTRKLALDTLLPRITTGTQRKTVHELDDAALLVLLLAHERGVGQFSRWLPYIASLPQEPSCGYSQKLRPYLLDTINALRDEMGMEVDGWPGELIRATEYSERIVSSLTNDYGSFIKHPKDVFAKSNIRWALCQVASRATGGSQKFGALRMIPLIDMLNHDSHAGGFVELTGEEKLEDGDFLDTTSEEIDGGAFVVRSLRHGRRKALKLGQELMVNYNVPHYSALDWLVSSGFVPPERYQNWQKLDAPLPRIRRDGPFAGVNNNDNDNNNNNNNNNAGYSRQESDVFGFASTA